MYNNMREVVADLEKKGMLLRITKEVDPDLEIAEIHRQVYDNKGPALLFEKIKGSPFQGLSNLYGTVDRTEYLFRKTIPKVKKVIEIKADPTVILKNPLKYLTTSITAITALHMKALFSKLVMYGQTSIDKLPMIKSWPMDGGAFTTLTHIFTHPPRTKHPMRTKLGMYKIKISSNDYKMN